MLNDLDPLPFIPSKDSAPADQTVFFTGDVVFPLVAIRNRLRDSEFSELKQAAVNIDLALDCIRQHMIHNAE